MDVLILNPPFKTDKGVFSRTSRSPAITKSGTNYYPLWLAYVTGVLEKAGHNVKFIDAAADSLSYKDVIVRIGGFNPKLIVIDTSTPSIYNDVGVAAKLKDVFPMAFVVLVGTHVSALPKRSLRLNSKVDAVAIGEYDYTLRDLVAALEKSGGLTKVKGLMIRKKNKIIFTGKRELIHNLDKIPFVSKVYKKHLNIKNYFFGAAQYPMVMIITGRGCPNYCSFCVYPQTFHSRAYRARSAENVVGEFEYIVRNLPFVKEIGIEDDTFTIDTQRVRRICSMLISRKIRIRWYCNVRANLDFETMRIMKKAGCRMITVGFESGDQKILNNIKKGITIKQIRGFVKNSKKAKLLVHAAYMVGNIGETKETMEETLKLAKELNTDMAQFFPIMLYPGTDSYEWAKKKGYLTTEDYSKWLTEDGQYDCVLTTPELTKKDLFDFCDRALREYYLRPRYLMMKTMQNFTHPSEVYRNIRSAAQLFKNIKLG